MPVVVAHSLAEAFAALALHPEAELLAGGTDFMVEVNAGRRRPAAVVSIRDVPELRGWRVEGPDVVLGAGLTYSEMLEPELEALVPGLAQAARTVGSPQIRNSGTIGGNLATASPAGDTIPVLVALDALVGIASAAGPPREVPVSRLLTGPKTTSLGPGDVITSVRIPASLGRQEFLKVGTRNAMIIAIASVACVVDAAGRSVRMALGSVGRVVIRAGEAEQMLGSLIDWDGPSGPALPPTPRPGPGSGSASAAGLGEVVAAVRAAAQPIDDHRATAAYRRHAVGVCAERALRRALGPPGGMRGAA